MGMNKQIRKMKKKLLKMLDKQLTIGYVNNFLRNKSIATNKHDENAITFKLYNLNWDLCFWWRETEYKEFIHTRWWYKNGMHGQGTQRA